MRFFPPLFYCIFWTVMYHGEVCHHSGMEIISSSHFTWLHWFQDETRNLLKWNCDYGRCSLLKLVRPNCFLFQLFYWQESFIMWLVLQFSVTELKELNYLMCFRHCGLNDPSWSELCNFTNFMSSQLRDCEQSEFCKDYLSDDLPGFRAFVLRFMLRMSKVSSTLRYYLWMITTFI